MPASSIRDPTPLANLKILVRPRRRSVPGTPAAAGQFTSGTSEEGGGGHDAPPDAILMYNLVRWCTIMDTGSELAPPVRSILRAAEARATPDERVAVRPRSLPDALAAAET